MTSIQFRFLSAIALIGSLSSCSHSLGFRNPAGQNALNGVLSDSTWTFENAKKFIRQAPSLLEPVMIIPRKEWDSTDRIRNLTDQSLSDIHTIVLHNTETRYHDQRGLKQVLQSHQETRGWDDIGYHFLIAQDSQDGRWKVYEGRALDKIGAHAGILTPKKGSAKISLNPNTIGIALVGTYVWKTDGKRAQTEKELGYPTNSAGKARLENILSMFPDANGPEWSRQPSREATEVLHRFIHQLVRDPRLTGLRKIRAHGALAPLELTPSMNDQMQTKYAINPLHTDCPGHGMIHIVESLQERYFPTSKN